MYKPDSAPANFLNIPGGIQPDRQQIHQPPPVQGGGEGQARQHLGYQEAAGLIVRIEERHGKEVLAVTISKRLLAELDLPGGAAIDVVPGSPWHLDIRSTAKSKLPERPGQTARFISPYRVNRALFAAAPAGVLRFVLDKEESTGYYLLRKA